MDVITEGQSRLINEQLRGFTDINKLPNGIALMDGENTGNDVTAQIVSKKIFDLRNGNGEEDAPDDKKLKSEEIYFEIASMSKSDQIKVFESLLEEYPDICWFRGGSLNTASDDFKKHPGSRDLIPNDNNLIVLDAPFGMLGSSDMAGFTVKGDNGIRDWPGMYVVYLRDLVKGIKNNQVEVRTGHGYDLMIDYPHNARVEPLSKSQGYYRWMSENVIFFDVRDMSGPDGTLNNAKMVENILKSKSKIVNIKNR